ncbi:MAG: multi-sensor signal transduction histidine kinase [Flavisolibacter sp.]|nr:multi-sensor signal transduction histidine kinase [Flavisolibacter sp.]
MIHGSHPAVMKQNNMNIKNLINKDAVNITNCESEPIHIPGSIQPHGFLLGAKKDDLTITHCSENCTLFLGVPVSEILGKPLGNFFSSKDITALEQNYLQATDELTRPFVFILSQKSYHVTAHVSGDIIVLEFEILSEEPQLLPDIFIQMRRFAYHTERADNLKMLCQDIADETRKITGYDRVMIYRFDKEYNGEVFAESSIGNIEPFLGLHYPHTDIPIQARELYLRNLVRMLTNIDYVPVPIYALADGDARDVNLDLSLSTLRSVSPIHVRYLKNMGVGATFVISLTHNKKLWGLISCHHYSPKHIPYHTRLAAHLQGIFLSSQIDIRQVADEFDLVKEADKNLLELRELLSKKNNSIDNIENLALIKKALNADAVIVHYKNMLFKEGALPGDEQLFDLINWLRSTIHSDRFHTSCLMRHYPAAEAVSDTIAGLIYVPLGSDSNNGIMWTRKEIEKTKNWAGDPSKAINVNEETKALTPRKSFEIWKESVRYNSSEWLKPELSASSFISFTIQQLLHLADLTEEETRYRNLNERLLKANEELANMNWISSHDLKEPLRKIRIYASLLLEKEANQIPESVKTTITRMQSSAERMQLLIEDLIAYTKIGRHDNRHTIDLGEILKEATVQLEEDSREKGATIQWKDLPQIKGDSYQVKQLFINLLGNALKFSKPGLPPAIMITCETVASKQLAFSNEKHFKNYYKITVADNGIGFDDQYKEEIFKIFQRLHANHYDGSGMGLAICKKIAEAHEGFIEATGIEASESKFTVYFPQQDSK